MKAHPIVDSPQRWFPTLATAFLLTAVQVVLLRCYAEAPWMPAVIDGVATVGWFLALSYLAWFVVGIVSPPRAGVLTVIVGILFWIAGSFMVCDIMMKIIGISYIPFAPTIPFRILFGVPAWTVVVLWYRLQRMEDAFPQETEYIAPEEATPSPAPEAECIDRITVKDGTRIHIIKTEEILYIQACGDYTTLVTPTGEYIKEQTMKYFDAHLPASTFVRIHRSTIVNVTCISRVELFGKETYQVLLKNGAKLRVSLSGYRLLKEWLGISSICLPIVYAIF